MTVKASYRTQAQAHAMMETHRAVSYLDVDGRLTVVSSTQCPFNVQRILATALGLPSNKVHVVKPRVGGGFGGKTNAIVEFYPALVTLKTGQPAKLLYTRQEAFQCTTRHAALFDVTLGADLDGTIQAMDVHALFDGGAYAEQSAVVLRVAGHKSVPLYNKMQAVRYYGDALYTNKVPASALRGYGVTQSTFAVESAVNRLAAALKMDPTVLRLRMQSARRYMICPSHRKRCCGQSKSRKNRRVCNGRMYVPAARIVHGVCMWYTIAIEVWRKCLNWKE